MFVDQVLFYIVDFFVVQLYFLFGSICSQFFCLLVFLFVYQFLFVLVVQCYGLFQVDVVFWLDDVFLFWYDVYQMVELFLDCFQIVEDVGMIKFKVVEDQCLWVVMYKFRMFIKECVVVFICFDNKEWVFVQVCGNFKVVWYVVNYEVWFVFVCFQYSGCYVCGCGFVVGIGDCQYLVIV